MNEKLLHYIWQYQLYNKRELTTTAGKTLEIIYPGIHNQNQGPDFLSGRIKIEQTLWVGSVEMHVKSSDWLHHRHDDDPNYQNVILHVVWQDDRKLNNDFETLEMSRVVPKLLLRQFALLRVMNQFIPCEKLLCQANPLDIEKCKEDMLTDRFREKNQWILNELKHYKGDWETVCMLLLARGFGGKVNADAFEALVRSLPQGIYERNKHQLLHVEAIMFGQAGMLEGRFIDEYPKTLQNEYAFLSRKYNLQPIQTKMYLLRMRPVSFPGIRIAQFSRFLFNQYSMMRYFISTENYHEIESCFLVEAGAYWNNHYHFDESSFLKLKRLGEQTINHLMINAVIPLIYAYGSYNKIEHLQARALSWMEKSKPESNKIIKEFEKRNISATSAYDTQALLQLKNKFCDQQRCLECAIGNSIFRKAA